MCEVQVPNAVLDVAWSENTPGLLAAACGDGKIRVVTVILIHLGGENGNKCPNYANSDSCQGSE